MNNINKFFSLTELTGCEYIQDEDIPLTEQIKKFGTKEELEKAISDYKKSGVYVANENEGAFRKYAPIKDWDVSEITDMSNLFKDWDGAGTLLLRAADPNS